MRRKQLFLLGIYVAFAALSAVSAIVVLGLETKREVFVFWESIGNFCRGVLLVSSIWVLVVTLLRWSGLTKALRIAGLGPTLSIVAIAIVSSALDHARPNVKLVVSYKGGRDDTFFDITTHYGSVGRRVKRDEEIPVSEGRRFPQILHVTWGTNSTRPQATKDFDLKGKIPRFGISRKLSVVLTDGGANLEIASESGRRGG